MPAYWVLITMQAALCLALKSYSKGHDTIKSGRNICKTQNVNIKLHPQVTECLNFLHTNQSIPANTVFIGFSTVLRQIMQYNLSCNHR